MRKDHDASGRERRRELPVPPPLQALERSPLSQLIVLGSIELVNLLLELLTIEIHFRTAGPRSRQQTTGSQWGRASASRGTLQRAADTLARMGSPSAIIAEPT